MSAPVFRITLFSILFALTLIASAEEPATTPKSRVTKRQLNPFQQMSALNSIQRQLQQLNEHIEDSHNTLDSLESFSRNKDRLNTQLRTIREDLILLRRSLAWLTRYTNVAKALVPNPYIRTDDFTFPSFFLPELFVDEPSPEAPREKVEITLKDDFEPPSSGEFPPFSQERFRDRMLRTDDDKGKGEEIGAATFALPRFEENRTIVEKDVEETNETTDEEIAIALPSSLEAKFKADDEAPGPVDEQKTSESFQTSSFLLPPIRRRFVERSEEAVPAGEHSFSFLPNFEVYRKFKDLSEVPLERHSFFDTPKSFRSSHTSFEAPIK